MKGFLAGAALALLVAGPALADTYVDGHYRNDGTYVPGHYRTEPNNTRNDNYSTRGNVNPYTGQPGTRPRDGESSYGRTSSSTSSYGSTTRRSSSSSSSSSSSTRRSTSSYGF